MIGTLNPKFNEVLVIGAGISGLLAAYYLDKKGYKVTLIEAQNRSGGLIQTEKNEYGMAESAAHSFLATDTVRDLCKELDLEILPVRKNSRARYILRNGRLRRFPLNLLETIKTILRAYFILADRHAAPDELSLDAWSRRFLGAAALKYLVTPFVRGIYGARPSDLSVGAAFPTLAIPHGHSLLSFALWRLRKRLFDRKNKHSRAEMMSPRAGMAALISKLDETLSIKLSPRFKKGVSVNVLPQCENLILAVPAGTASELLAKPGPFQDLKLSHALKQVSYAPLVCATAFVHRESLRRSIRGIGVLVPEGENRSCLGILFNSSSFEGRVTDEAKYASFTVMIGGTGNPEFLGKTDEQLKEIIKTELLEVLGLVSTSALDPIANIVIRRQPRAVPVYNSALSRAWCLAHTGLCSKPGRVLFGNYTGQVSVRGMIESAATLAAGLQQQ